MNLLRRTARTTPLKCALVAALGATMALGSMSAWSAPTPDRVPVPDALRTATEMLPDLMPPMREAMPLFDAAIGGRPGSIRLTGLYSQRSFTFGVMRDEVVSDASITLLLKPSTTLKDRSIVNVVLNDHLLAAVPLVLNDEAKKLGVTQEGDLLRVTLPVDGRSLRGYNRIDLTFEGHYQDACQNPMDSSLWVEVDQGSFMTLAIQRLRNPNELTYLPGPFISKNARTQQTLPIAFAQAPTEGELEAAGIIASWAGREADWRGVKLPAYVNEAPVDTHFVTFMTAKHRPAFLKDFPEPKGPGVTIMAAPFSLWAKMLVISGRDEAELKQAAAALATGSAIFSGESVTLTDLPPIQPRAPYDAPRWVRTDRPVTLESLTTYRGQLSARGIDPAPIHLLFRLPPDLYTLERQTVPLQIATAASAPAQGGDAQLRVRFNNAMVATNAITSENAGANNDTKNHLLRFTALTPGAGRWDSVGVPGVYLKPENDLEIDFRYNVPVNSGNLQNCRYTLPLEQQGDVDPTSTIDFSGFYHYAVLPDLSRFTRAGYPFTVHADLATTTVVLPEKATATDLGIYLTTIARMGAQTGAAATAVTVKTPKTFDKAKAQDVILVGNLSANTQTVKQIEDAVAQMKVADTTNVLTAPAFASLVAMESPFAKGRSLVALLTGNPDSAKTLLTQLATPAMLNTVTGATTILAKDQITNHEPKATYTVGDIPATAKLWAMLSNSPWMLVGALLIVALVIGVLSYALMRLRIRARLALKEADHE
mgnify:FL=1